MNNTMRLILIGWGLHAAVDDLARGWWWWLGADVFVVVILAINAWFESKFPTTQTDAG